LWLPLFHYAAIFFLWVDAFCGASFGLPFGGLLGAVGFFALLPTAFFLDCVERNVLGFSKEVAFSFAWNAEGETQCEAG
jgi:hypothetical protein